MSVQQYRPQQYRDGDVALPMVKLKDSCFSHLLSLRRVQRPCPDMYDLTIYENAKHAVPAHARLQVQGRRPLAIEAPTSGSNVVSCS